MNKQAPQGNQSHVRRALGPSFAATFMLLAATASDSAQAAKPSPPATGAIYGAYSHALHYGLDGNGNRTLITDAAGITTSQTFDAHNRLTQISSAEGTTLYTWRADSTLGEIIRGDGTRSTYQYDQAKRISSLTHFRDGAVTLTFNYQYDRNGNRTEQIRTQSAMSGQAGSIRTTIYTYDNDDRLTATEVRHQPQTPLSPDERIQWGLDGAGNRLSEVVTRLSDNTVTSSKAYNYSARDQLLRMEDVVSGLVVTFTYDGNGNRTSRTVAPQSQPAQTTTYFFDARNLMIRVVPEAPNMANAPTIEYVYDAEGRRVERIETATNGATQVSLFVYDGRKLLHEAVPAAVPGGLRITDTYRRGAKLDRHIAHTGTGSIFQRSYQLDAQDTPVAMTDSTGATVTRTVFDAWGNVLEQVADGVVQAPWQLPSYNPNVTGQAALLRGDGQGIGFTGYEKDEATGLYLAGARFYDPMVGQFNAMDSALGDNHQPITLNKYLYANASPARFVDPTGKYAEEGHYYTTYYVALRVGYSNEEAAKLALFSQLPDEVGTYDAVNAAVGAAVRHMQSTAGANTADQMVEVPQPELGLVPVQRGMHALSGLPGDKETAITVRAIRKSSDLATLGVLIHRLGDTFAHRGLIEEDTTYVHGVGHGYAGTTPDQIMKRPVLYAEYVRTLANTLSLKKNRRALSSEEMSDIARPLLKEAIMAKQQGAKESAEFMDERDAAIAETYKRSGAHKHGNMPSRNQLTNIGVPVPDVPQYIRNRYAALIERETGQRLTLRPEQWSAAVTDGEGSEVDNLRGLFQAQGILVSETELHEMAGELNGAANNAVNVVREGSSTMENRKSSW